MSDRWLIIDSSSVLHRCFHGYVNPQPGVLDRRTLDVAALAGYVAYTHKLRREFDFEHLVHVLDSGTASHYRVRMFPEYKGNRGDSDPFFTAQKLLLPRMLRSLGENVLCHPGYEADDVIGTLADQVVKQDGVALILTKDKDLFQLVEEERVCIAHYVKDENNYNVHRIFSTDEEVVEKMGVRPDQITDFLALVGDAIDNIPGVDGVGDTTAAGWLSTHGDIHTLLANADSIKGKRGESLRASRDNLMLYKQLTTVCRDVPGVTLAQAIQPPLPDADERKKMLDCLSWPSNWTWDAPVPPAPGFAASAAGRPRTPR